ncbi:MAG: aspartate-semialdehyde dehydrogenase [Rhabdochlamydiaceae bacterium]|nr:aspartate-semialdehyde dehydrogenase [Candidatus Amphrikana amoebophyrae]
MIKSNKIKNLIQKKTISIIGATGEVGKTLVKLIELSPNFQIGILCASQKKIKSNRQYVTHDEIAPNSLVISALKSDVAKEIEEKLLKKGCRVITNAQALRYDLRALLSLPDVNGEQILNAKNQLYAVPNCVSTALALALKPLSDLFGIESVHVTTLQAVSGAGKSEVGELNIIPYIEGEEEKIEYEPLKLLNVSFPISSTAIRVPVLDGHTQSVSIKFKTLPQREEIISAWNNYKGLPQKNNLFFAAKNPIVYLEDPFSPQTLLHLNDDKGMRISIGRLRKCLNFHFKFVMLSHNRIQGAAGAALAICEILTARKENEEASS